MATKTAAKKATPKTTQALTDDELSALKETVLERKATARRGSTTKADGERDLLAKIAEMPEADRVMAERIHAIVTEAAPDLWPKTWYGMPAYANKDGKLICFFKAASKFDSRYATFGFEETAKLDDGTMWSTSWAITKLTPADEKSIAALVKRAVS